MCILFWSNDELLVVPHKLTVHVRSWKRKMTVTNQMRRKPRPKTMKARRRRRRLKRRNMKKMKWRQVISKCYTKIPSLSECDKRRLYSVVG